MFGLIRHELKNSHGVGYLEKGFYRTFGPGNILQKNNCQNALDDHLNDKKIGENWGKHLPFPREKISCGRVSTGRRGRGFWFRYNIRR